MHRQYKQLILIIYLKSNVWIQMLETVIRTPIEADERCPPSRLALLLSASQTTRT